MKKLFLAALLTILLVPEVAWGLDCIKFQNMSVKIIKQEDEKVYLAWDASVINKCKKMVSIKVQMQFVDEKEKHLGSSFKSLNTINANETRKIQGEKSLPSETYYKIHTYYFKSRDLSGLFE